MPCWTFEGCRPIYLASRVTSRHHNIRVVDRVRIIAGRGIKRRWVLNQTLVENISLPKVNALVSGHGLGFTR